MAYEFKLPDLGEGLAEGEIARWLVAEGDELSEDDPLVEIQTDKTTVEIPSPAAGTVTRILVAEGEVVPVGTVLVVIGGDGTAGDGAAGDSEEVQPRAEPAEQQRAAGTAALVTQSHKPPSERVQATPLVRRLAEQLGVDLAALRGSGPNGRIVESDIRASVAQGAEGGAEEIVPEQHNVGEGVGEGRREPVRGVRRQIVERLARAHREVAAVTFVEECDFTGIELQRLVPLALGATAQALREFPELNARLEDDEIVFLDRYDIGVAVQTERGLVVPVVRGCDGATTDELAAEVARLAEAARAGTVQAEELRGGTFTITSAGKLGGVFVTPLVNHPEVGILGIHRIAPRPVVRDGELAVRESGHVSITFDHRVVDGARAAAFCLDVIGRLEQLEA
ncbi:MAG: dihydrolipoamide acetyltransferase family protein [Gaiellaceae bacterium]